MAEPDLYKISTACVSLMNPGGMQTMRSHVFRALLTLDVTILELGAIGLDCPQ